MTVTSPPNVEQQQVLDRITVQRKRLHARRAARAQAMALTQHTLETDDNQGSFAVRAMGFARAHPVVVASLVGAAAVAGPRRLTKWIGVLLPIVLRIRR